MVSPKRFLPPESEPWGRSVDQDLAQIKLDNAKALGESTNAFKAINSSMNLVSKQIASLTALTATLAAQQIALSAQQAELANVVAAQTEALKSVVTPSWFYLSASNFGTPAASMVARATTTLTTPAGFTKAIVTANSFVVMTNTTGGVAIMQGQASINGVGGPSPIDQDIVPSGQGVVAAAYSSLVSGLTGGSTFDVSSRVYTPSAWGADATNRAVINGTVIWFR